MTTLRLSVIIAGSGSAGPPMEALGPLAPHAAHGTVEVILATAAPNRRAGETPLPAGVRLLRLPPETSVPRLRSAGLAAARAELGALTEDFCVPTEGWVAATLEAHARHDVAAVGGPMDRQAGTLGDWALSFCDYGRFFGARPDGPVGDLCGANVAYRLSRLRHILGVIPEEFEEWRVHAALRQRAEVLWWEPRMVMLDRNPMPFGRALVSVYHHGRLFGGGRVRGRGLGIRLARVGLTPLVPLVHLARVAPRVLLGRRAGRMLAALPLMIALLGAWALGEGVGSLAGEGVSRQRWR